MAPSNVCRPGLAPQTGVWTGKEVEGQMDPCLGLGQGGGMISILHDQQLRGPPSPMLSVQRSDLD